MVQLYSERVLGLPKGASSHTYNTSQHAVPVQRGQCTCQASVSCSNDTGCYNFQNMGMSFARFKATKMQFRLWQCSKVNRSFISSWQHDSRSYKLSLWHLGTHLQTNGIWAWILQFLSMIIWDVILDHTDSMWIPWSCCSTDRHVMMSVERLVSCHR